MLKNKPLIRWTIGPVAKEGFVCLKLAVELMQSLYKDTCNYAVCYNGLSNQQKSLLPNVNLLVNQENYSNLFHCNPPVFGFGGPAWKLYPPRLNMDSHEIIIDNDVIIYKKPEQFNIFFKKNIITITEAITRSYSKSLEHLIPEGYNINSGVICLPPNFDFEKKISNCIKLFNLNWQNHFDEQTLIAYITSQQTVQIIPLLEIQVSNFTKNGNCGNHFIGLNSGYNPNWAKCKKEFIKLI